MTSKEALEYLTSKVFTGGNSILEIEAEECKTIILKNLERLEVLENRIKNKIKDFEKEIEIARYNENYSRAFNLSFEIDLLKKLLEVD